MPTASSLAERLLSASQDAVETLQQIKERGALPMIDRGDIRQQSTVAAIWAYRAGYGQFEHKAGQPDCKIQRSGRNGRL